MLCFSFYLPPGPDWTAPNDSPISCEFKLEALWRRRGGCDRDTSNRKVLLRSGYLLDIFFSSRARVCCVCVPGSLHTYPKWLGQLCWSEEQIKVGCIPKVRQRRRHDGKRQEVFCNGGFERMLLKWMLRCFDWEDFGLEVTKRSEFRRIIAISLLPSYGEP